jgi:hypothetical protein
VVAVAVVPALVNAAYPAAASWDASSALWGGWFPPLLLVAGMGRGGDRPSLEGAGPAAAMAVGMAVAWRW